MLTNDVETTSIFFNDTRPETGYKVWKEGMPLLLDLYAEFNVKSTFFFCIDIVKLYPEIVKMILPYNHEVASHGYSHELNDAFDRISFDKQKEFLILSKKILEDISGQEVVSFRAPALRVNRYTAAALSEAGFTIDSSIPSQRFDFFLSHGSINKLKWFLSPRFPYRTDPDDITRKGNGKIIEVPLSASFFPFIGTTLRIMPLVTKFQRYFLHLETCATKKPAVFIIHPNEFIDESSEERIITRRSKSFMAYMFADIIRGKIKMRNLGPVALPLYKEMVKFYVNKKYTFTTVKEYASSTYL
jgi:hypothetical protein